MHISYLLATSYSLSLLNQPDGWNLLSLVLCYTP